LTSNEWAEGQHQASQIVRFARCDFGIRYSRRYGGHRTYGIGGGIHRRQRKPQSALAPRGKNAIEAEAERDRITAERRLDRLAGQGLGLAVEQRLGRQGRAVAGSLGPARIASRERSAPRFPCVITRAAGHTLLFSQRSTFTAMSHRGTAPAGGKVLSHNLALTGEQLPASSSAQQEVDPALEVDGTA
jgi:hypothetical protein